MLIRMVITGSLFSQSAHVGWSVPCLFDYKAVTRGHITRDILSPHWGIGTHYNTRHFAIKCDLPCISCRTGIYSFVIIIMTLFIGRSRTWGLPLPPGFYTGCHLLYTAEWLGCSHTAVQLCFLRTWLSFALVRFLRTCFSSLEVISFSSCGFLSFLSLMHL